MGETRVAQGYIFKFDHKARAVLQAFTVLLGFEFDNKND